MRIYTFLLLYIFFCFFQENYTHGQEFNNIIVKDSITSFFKKNKLEKTINTWGFTFIDKDSLKLKTTINKLALPNTSFSDIYLTDFNDDPNKKGFARNYYAIDLIETYNHNPKSLYKRYKNFLKLSEALGISLIGFHIEVPREHYLSLNKIETNKSLSDPFVIEGTVFNKKTGSPIPYVNIGFFEKNIGTVSNHNGTFTLEISQKFKEQEITFSCIGYKTKKINIDTLITTSSQIFLEENITSLEEVIVYANAKNKIRKRVLGVKNVSGKQSGFINGKGAGAEIARLMRNRSKAMITSVSIHIGGNRFTEFKLRLNIYSANKSNLIPQQNLMTESKIIESDLNFGWLTVILDQPILVDSDFLVAFEWLDANVNNPVISLKGNLSDDHVFQRMISQGEWIKSHDFNWAIKCEIQIIE